MNKDELWYIVERHSNMRLHSKDGPLIHDDFPIRVSEYHEIYG
jgi:hypothetical protein